MKKSLLGSASSKASLAAAVDPAALGAAQPHEEKREGHAHGGIKPAAAPAPGHKGDKPKKTTVANPANAFRGAGRGS